MSENFFVKKIISPIERFLNLEANSGFILLGAAILALIFANSSLWPFYQTLLDWPLSFHFGEFTFKMSLYHWVNDGLMVIFFFLVGLEIKKELIIGSLSSKQKAVLPFMAALGGMVVPACIYLMFNISKESAIGWAIPMATDIAFAVGVLTFLSRQVPFSLKIFLLALATIDDLGAVLVIASFYSENISGFWLSLSGIFIFFVFYLKHLQVQKWIFYVFLGVGLWFCVYNSGIHATIAGVILGLMTPVRPLLKKKDIKTKLEKFILHSELSTLSVEDVRKTLRKLQSPAQLLIDILHKWVSFFIMPVFAFFNSGLRFDEHFSFSQFSLSSVTQGIFLGLVVGKPLGIFLFSWFSVQRKWTTWPEGVRPFHILGVGFLAGIGFTMALFISHLSMKFDPVLETFSKVSILSASLLAGIIGFIVLFLHGKHENK